MDSLYNRNNYRKKNKKSKSTINATTNETPKTNKKTKSKKKNNTLKGGNPTNDHMSGKQLIEQTFQNDKADSTLENKQEDNTNFILLARKMVDNS